MNFTIDQVSWHTKVQGNPESKEQIVNRFWQVANFLQSNGLTTKKLADRPSDIDESFGIESADLTEQGLLLMKKVYDKWLTKVDGGMPSTDLSMFEKALKVN